MAEPAPSAKVPRRHASDESIKDTFESIVIAFILAFVFRAYVVEAFVIPTGSMAPTLLGQHFRVTCTQCGYRHTCDGPEGGRPVPRYGASAICPMCHYPNPLPSGSAPIAGDRILVHKFIYSLSEPRRWDVIVFKAPHDPEINFIKRLVGLPNESLAIVEGNIFVQRLAQPDEPPTPWLIARKSDRPRVQRTVWQPIYHTPFVPLDDGDDEDSPDRVSHPWRLPWVPETADAWKITPRRGFRYSGDGPGRLRFDFQAWGQGGSGLYAYNHLKPLGNMIDEPIEDIRLAAVVQASQPGPQITLATTARLDGVHGPLPLRASILADGTLELTTLHPTTGEPRVLASLPAEQAPRLHPGRSRLLELWYVDQQASFWIDGERQLAWQYDLPNSEELLDSPIMTRPGPAMRPDISVTVRGGGEIDIHRLELDRDLYYGATSPGSERIGRAAVVKLMRGTQGSPIALAADEFFTLGDNSPQSSDGRFWDEPADWITHRMFAANIKPEGIVPRKLLIGRAFFVYFPGPYRVRSLPVPNFGDMRFIH